MLLTGWKEQAPWTAQLLAGTRGASDSSWNFVPVCPEVRVDHWWRCWGHGEVAQRPVATQQRAKRDAVVHGCYSKGPWAGTQSSGWAQVPTTSQKWSGLLPEEGAEPNPREGIKDPKESQQLTEHWTVILPWERDMAYLATQMESDKGPERAKTVSSGRKPWGFRYQGQDYVKTVRLCKD